MRYGCGFVFMILQEYLKTNLAFPLVSSLEVSYTVTLDNSDLTRQNMC